MKDKSMDIISEMISNMKFRKKIIGGVDELDVWNKIELLQKEYNRLYELQRKNYEAVIEELKSGGEINEDS